VILEEGLWGHCLVDVAQFQRYKKNLQADIHIYHQIPSGFKRTGKYNIGYFVFETTHLPKIWVPKASIMDEIWTSSTFCKKIFQNDGIDKPIRVVPHGINPDIFNPQVQPLKIKGLEGFVFLTVISGNIYRKGLDLLLDAYLEEFNKADNVSLIIKTTKQHVARYQVMREIVKRTKNDSPKIFLLDRYLTQEQMARLYIAANCFVCPTRGEAWQIPAMEALSCEIPVITTNWGGHLDYLNHYNSYLIAIEELEPTQKHGVRWYDPAYMKWAKPLVTHLKGLMSYVTLNYEEAKRKAIKGRKLILEKYTWKHVAGQIIDILKGIEL